MNDSSKLEQIQQRAEKRAKTGKFFTAFLIIILVLFFLIMAFENLFNIKRVTVDGVSDFVPYTTDDVSAFLDIKKDTNLITYDTKKAEKALLYEFPYIKEIEINKKLPNILEVNIIEDKGTMYIDLGDDIFIVSSGGKVLEITNDPFYDGQKRTHILTSGVKRCICGEKMAFDKEDKLDVLCEVTEALEKYSMIEKVTEIDTSDKFNIKFSYDNRFKISFGTFEKADTKVKFLFEMLGKDIWRDSTGEIDISNPSEALVKFTGNVAN